MKSGKLKVGSAAAVLACAVATAQARWIEDGAGGGWGPVASERALLLDQGRAAQTVVGGEPCFADGLRAGVAGGDWTRLGPYGLSALNGEQTVVDTEGLSLMTAEGVTIVGWGSGTLHSPGDGSLVLELVDRRLYGGDSVTVDFASGQLHDPVGGGVSLRWMDERIAYGLSGPSVDWGNRLLCADDGVAVLDWSGDAVALGRGEGRVVIDSDATPIEGANVGTIYDVSLAGWTNLNGKAVHGADGASSFYVNVGSLQPLSGFAAGQTGQFSFRISDRTAGHVVATFYEMDTTPVPLATATNNGTYSVAFTANQEGVCDLAFEVPSNARLSIDQIRVTKDVPTPLEVDGTVAGTGYRVTVDGEAVVGVSGSFTSADGKTVTVSGGIVTGIAGP